MANKWRISKELYVRITELESDLGAFAQEQRDKFADMSEHWQESDKGTEVDAWIDQLSDLQEALDNVPESALMEG